MASVELLMPKMGESIMEATILKWLKKEGDTVAIDEPVLEIATDKVDSEVPSPITGVISKIIFKEGETIPVGKAIAIIGTESKSDVKPSPAVAEKKEEAVPKKEKVQQDNIPAPAIQTPTKPEPIGSMAISVSSGTNGHTSRFYSPLVLNIAKQERIGMVELENIPGTGKDARVTKRDILNYLEHRSGNGHSITVSPTTQGLTQEQHKSASIGIATAAGNTEIMEMDRMRQLIADHMVMSKKTSPHVTSFVEADVTPLVLWREKHKNTFQKREGEKLTFTPLFIEAVVKAIKDFPLVNCSLDGRKILLKKDINIGMATALPSGNLIVPVIKNADQKSLLGITKEVNDLANRARNNKLKPNEIEGGTFTLTNVGTFGNLMGTPIINQPQVAILATGIIKKKPVVVESPMGDSIAIRHMMFLSLSYDHRIVDGALGGSFLRRIADYLEGFDSSKSI